MQCSIDSYEERPHARGWCKCNRHYLRWQQHGWQDPSDPQTKPNPPQEAPGVRSPRGPAPEQVDVKVLRGEIARLEAFVEKLTQERYAARAELEEQA